MTNHLWTLEFSDEALKQLKKLDKQISAKIVAFVKERISGLKDPRTLGKPLTGNLATYWRYRVGDYRVVCQINDQKILITVVKIGHRKEIYD
ncbi:toxin RelE (plasmid) [Candidatus Paracaedimonas acanthamoebae]|nr:toxin RelE [Candidatus Paracaedimonas acanthamoebae]